MENNSERILGFTVFVFNTRTGELFRKGRNLRIPSQAASVLTVLLENSGAMVTREELRSLLWPNGEVIDFDQSINRVVSQLRAILGERQDKPSQLIDTLPKRGYRFKASVVAIPPGAPVSPSLDLRPTDQVSANLDQPTGSTELSVAATLLPEEPIQQPQPALTIERRDLFEPVAPSPMVRRRSSPRFRSSRVAIGTAVVCAASLLTAAVWWFSPYRLHPGSPVLSLGIVPFEESGPDAGSVAESFRLDLADSLSQMPGVEIRAAHAFNNSGTDESQIRRHAVQLGVKALLFGKFTLKDNQCTLQLELVRSEDGVHLSSFHYAGNRDELALIRDHVQRDLFLRLSPSGSINGVAKINTPSSKAYDSYLRGRYYLSQWTDPSLNNAILSFQDCLQKQPDYARAYAGEASAYYVLAQHGAMPMDESLRHARENANRALQLDRSLAEPYAILGQVAMSQDWNFPLAEEQLHRAVELDPYHAMYRLWLSILYCEEGKFEAALQQIDMAHAADPSWSPIYMTEIFVAGTAHNFQRANEASLKLIKSMPDWSLAHEQRAILLWNTRQYEEAISEWKNAAVLEKNTDRIRLEDDGLDAFRKSGVPGYARVRLQAIKTRTGLSHDDADFVPAEWHAYAGELDTSLTELEEMVNHHSQQALQIGNSPAYLKLHGTPRFNKLIERIGLPAPTPQ
jgi:DNA-binding winged helix-turn-helix (wHTH) protein/tetratricopeptide (TPR) repeat protein/TolB-like protein